MIYQEIEMTDKQKYKMYKKLKKKELITMLIQANKMLDYLNRQPYQWYTTNTDPLPPPTCDTQLRCPVGM